MKILCVRELATKLLVYLLVVSLNLLYMPLIGFTSAEAANDSPRVYVFGFAPDGDKTPLELQGMLEVQFKDHFDGETRLDYISAKEARKMLKGKKRGKPTEGLKGSSKAYKRAKKYLRLAGEAVEEAENEDLMKAGDRAVKYYRKAANHVKDFDDIKNAYLYQAMGLEVNDEDGSDAMKTVLAFDPDYKPSGDERDALGSAYKKAHRAAKKAKGRLKIQTDPEDAQVLINGREFDHPVKARKLVDGDYYIRVEAKGFKKYTGLVEMEGAAKSLTIVLEAKEQADEGDSADKMAVFKELNQLSREQNYNKSFFDNAADFAKWIKADFLVFAAFKTEDDMSAVYPLVYSAENGELGEVGRTEFTHDMEDADEGVELAYNDTKRAILRSFPEKIVPVGGAVGFVAVAAVEDEPEEVFEEEEEEEEMVEEIEDEPEPEPAYVVSAMDLDVDDNIYFSDDDLTKAQEDTEGEESIAPTEKTPIYKEWWFWTIIGAVVVGGSVTAAVMLQPEDNDQSSRLVLPAR